MKKAEPVATVEAATGIGDDAEGGSCAEVHTSRQETLRGILRASSRAALRCDPPTGVAQRPRMRAMAASEASSNLARDIGARAARPIIVPNRSHPAPVRKESSSKVEWLPQ